MFGYYLDLALRSLKRNKALTALMILTVGFGVAASMTTWSVIRAVSGDPIPWKSSKLYVPQMDNWGPTAAGAEDTANEPPDARNDAAAIASMRAHRAKHQSAMYQIATAVVPTRVGEPAIMTIAEAAYGGFFPLLAVPFQYGSGWSAGDDE